MDNENNSLFVEQNNNINNNRRGLLKFITSSIINILFISTFISISMKYTFPKDNLSNKSNNILSNTNINLRNLAENNNNKDSKNKTFNIDNDFLKKYINLFLENLDNRYESLKDMILGKPLIMSKEIYYAEKQKQIFLARLIKNIYSGTWEYYPYTPEEPLDFTKNITVTKFYYINSSNNNFKIGNAKNGTVTFNFKRAIEMTSKQEALAMTMKNLEGDYIDNWIQHISYAKITDTNRTVDLKNKLYIFKGEFSTSMIKGKIFNNRKNNKNKIQCGTLVQMYFPLTEITLQTNLNNKTFLMKNISTIDPSNFTMILSSMCGFRIKINAQIYNMAKENIENKIKVNYYTYFCIFASVLYLIGAICLTFSLNENENAISCISLECYCQNIAWHSYSGITNINFGLYFSENFGNFCIIGLIPLINFIIIDLRFLYFFWRIKKRYLNDRQFIKLRLKFFGLFYGFLLFSFFSISVFYTSKMYITILSVFLWTPQIIHNIINNNKYIYPSIYIIANTLDRIVFPFYFRGCKNNFLKIKADIVLIIILSIYILISIIILYLQTFLGPRFMLPLKYQKKKIDFHKTKEELLEEFPESTKEECVICLSPLIEEEKKSEVNNNDNNNNNNANNMNYIINNNEPDSESSSDSPTQMNVENNSKSTNSSVYLNNSKNLNLDNNINNKGETNKNNKDSLNINVKNINNNSNKINNKCLLFEIIGKIFKIIFCTNLIRFYKSKYNLKDRKYMVIACGHIFHSECVEKWFERKKECPNCRASMEEYL